jgi:tetratricopeptide (TPR) repeat protein
MTSQCWAQLRGQGLFALVALSYGLVGLPAGAQRLAPKRSLAVSGPAGCAAYPAPPTPPTGLPSGDDADTRRLIDQGQEAAAQGEHAAARDAFARAAEQAPGNARLAYYLGREHEALNAGSDAVRQYCRYLALAPDAPDTEEVQSRIARLVPAQERSRIEEARASFRSGVALLERREFGAADSVFGAVATRLPTAPEIFFNRGLARAARGERAGAMEDLEQYLALSPAGSDRAAVLAAMTRLQEPTYSAGQAFGSGLLLPGMGQMTTGRPVIGVAVLGAVAGAAAFGLMEETRTEARTCQDPFGNPYPCPQSVSERPNAAAAGAVAAVLWIGAALEARGYANRTQARAQDILQLAVTGQSLGIRLSFALGR